MIRDLSERLPFEAFRWSHATIPPRIVSADGEVVLRGVWTTTDRSSVLFQEPRLVVSFGGHRTYLPDATFLDALSSCASHPDGKFMLDMGGGREKSEEWIEATEAGRILAWLDTWLQRLQPGNERIVLNPTTEVLLHPRLGYCVLTRWSEHDLGNDYYIVQDTGIARQGALDAMRAADIADYLNLVASKPKEETA